LRGLLLIGLGFGGGCYSPNPIEGAACAPGGECPSSLTCSHGTCVTKGTEPDAFVCTPIVTTTGRITAPSFTPTIDGDLADWTSCFVTLDPTNGIVVDHGAMTGYPSGRFSVAHDATHVYVAAAVQGVLPLGDQAPLAIYENNSISFYLDGDGSFLSAKYDSDAAQIVIDHANQQQSFRTGTPISLPNLTSAAQTSASIYTIEMAVTAGTFGLASFGDTIGFDIGFEGGNGTKQTSEVYWYQSCDLPTCGCSNGTTAAPYCDARELGIVTLK
jgi:hypothetical protein